MSCELERSSDGHGLYSPTKPYFMFSREQVHAAQSASTLGSHQSGASLEAG